VRNLKERSTREGDSVNDLLAQPSRSLAIQDTKCFPTYYQTRNPFRPDSITYPLSHVMDPPCHERELQYLLHNRHPLEAMDTSARAEMLQKYRNDVSFLSYDELLSERANKWSTSLNENDDRFRENHPTNSRYLPSRRRQTAGLTRSLTERRPKITRLDKNFRRSFTGRVEDYRMENARRTNFSIETSL